MKRRAHVSPVTPSLREAVLRRDGLCVAVKLGFVHTCRDQWGNPHRADDLDKLTLDHVHHGYASLGKRAPSDLDHLLSLCWFSHLLGWATANRSSERAYLVAQREERAA